MSIEKKETTTKKNHQIKQKFNCATAHPLLKRPEPRLFGGIALAQVPDGPIPQVFLLGRVVAVRARRDRLADLVVLAADAQHRAVCLVWVAAAAGAHGQPR